MFHRLYLWTDRNHDAVADEGEIPPFGEQFSAIPVLCEPVQPQRRSRQSFCLAGHGFDTHGSREEPNPE
jgi:hypothetical protein